MEEETGPLLLDQNHQEDAVQQYLGFQVAMPHTNLVFQATNEQTLLDALLAYLQVLVGVRPPSEGCRCRHPYPGIKPPHLLLPITRTVPWTQRRGGATGGPACPAYPHPSLSRSGFVRWSLDHRTGAWSRSVHGGPPVAAA